MNTSAGQPRRRARSRASVTTDIHSQVSAMVAGGMPRMAAFQAVADEVGKSRSAVAAAYYRVAGDAGRERTARRPTPVVDLGPVPPIAGEDSDALLAALVENMAALAELLRQQRSENAALRARLEQVRGAVIEP